MSFPLAYSCSPALTTWITHQGSPGGFMTGPRWLQFLCLPVKGRSDLAAQLWIAQSRGWVRHTCSSEGHREAGAVGELGLLRTGTPFRLNKWAILSLSTEVSVGEMTPTAYLCAQAGLGKVLLHGFRAGMLTALGKSPSVPSSCALSLEATQARGSCAQQRVPTHCLNDVALFWTITIMSNTMTGKTIPWLGS